MKQEREREVENRTLSLSLCLSYLRCLSLFSLSFFSMTMAMCLCVVCNLFVWCDVVVVLLCCGCGCACCRACSRVSFLLALTKTLPCAHSKRSRAQFQNARVCRQNARVLCETGVLTAHTGASRADCMSVSSVSVSLFISLSLVGYLFPFSMFCFDTLTRKIAREEFRRTHKKKDRNKHLSDNG